MDRAAGALVGLAVGDALGTTLEFSLRDSKQRLTDMVGGGPFNLRPGEWTDDTAMALCLAESLLACPGLVERDLMDRFVRWWRDGYNSCTGSCDDIGNTTQMALQRYQSTGDPIAGDEDPDAAGNGSLMRLAPVAIRWAHDPESAEEAARRQSATTHAATEAVDACAFMSRLLCTAIQYGRKSDLVRPKEFTGAAAVAAIAAGSWKTRTRAEISSSGYVIHTLEASMWALDKSETFEQAVLLAANLGDDADTVAAVTGQLAGAVWGLKGIRSDWLAKLAWRDTIESLARRLYETGAKAPLPLAPDGRIITRPARVPGLDGATLVVETMDTREKFGTASAIPLSDVFDGEATEFTPWLSQNLDRLTKELGFELEPDDTEVSVGAFRVDLVARTTDGRTVIIENQFNRTDHSHLGQLLTYAAGLQADIVIWICEQVREEHRAVIDWLNNKAKDADFFAVEAKAIRIDDGRPALLWNVIASPNEWTRGPRPIRNVGPLSPREELSVEYWSTLNREIDERGARLTRYKPHRSNWQGGTIGASNGWLNSAMGTRDKWIRVEVYLDGRVAEAWFDKISERKEEIEADLGCELDWDRAENHQYSRISTTLAADPEEKEEWPQQHRWIIEKRLEFEKTFRPIVKSLKAGIVG